MELTSRVEALEHELEIKDNLIIELQDELIFKVSITLNASQKCNDFAFCRTHGAGVRETDPVTPP